MHAMWVLIFRFLSYGAPRRCESGDSGVVRVDPGMHQAKTYDVLYEFVFYQ